MRVNDLYLSLIDSYFFSGEVMTFLKLDRYP
jgi:hypothetical protein